MANTKQHLERSRHQYDSLSKEHDALTAAKEELDTVYADTAVNLHSTKAALADREAKLEEQSILEATLRGNIAYLTQDINLRTEQVAVLTDSTENLRGRVEELSVELRSVTTIGIFSGMDTTEA